MEEIKKLHDQQTLAKGQPIEIEIDGCILTEKYHRYKDVILDFDVHDSDVWVCSFPKTGTTWTQEMTWLIANDLDYEGATTKLPLRFPFLECSAMFNPRAVSFANQGDTIEAAKNMKERRFIKTHLPWHLLPKQIQTGQKKPKMIYITRDPRDACVSFYHHHRRSGISYSFDNFCELFLGDQLQTQPFWGHVFGYWNRREYKNLLLIRYEEMQENLSAVVERVAHFLGKKIKEEQLEKLLDHLSFNKMKNNNAVNYKMPNNNTNKDTANKGNADFMRSGTSGNYKEWMSPEMIGRFNTWIRENTSGTDFHFYDN